MAAIDDLKVAVQTLAANDAALKTSVDAAVAKIAALAGQVAALASVPNNEAEISALAGQISGAASDLASEKAAIDAAVAPPVPVDAPAAPAA